MKKSNIHIGPGASSLILILVMLAMSVLGMLTYISSRNDLRLSLRSAEVAQAVYELNERSEETFAMLAEQIGDQAEEGDIAPERLQVALEKAAPEKEFEIRDNTIAWTEEDPYRALDCAVRFEIRPEEADGVSLSWIMHQMSGVSTYVEDEWE